MTDQRKNGTKKYPPTAVLRRWKSWSWIQKLNFIICTMALMAVFEISYEKINETESLGLPTRGSGAITATIIDTKNESEDEDILEEEEESEEEAAVVVTKEDPQQKEDDEKKRAEEERLKQQKLEEQKRVEWAAWTEKKGKLLAEPLKSLSTKSGSPFQRPRECTNDDLLKIQENGLSPRRCTGIAPWHRKCSFTWQTICHNSTWLHGYSDEIHGMYNSHDYVGEESFFGIFVGCKGGFSAFGAMKLFSRDPVFDGEKWKNEIRDEPDCLALSHVEDHVALVPPTRGLRRHDKHPKKGREPMVVCMDQEPVIINEVASAAKKLGLDNHGFTTHLALMTNEEATVDTSGQEEVPTETIDQYMTIPGREDVIVDILSIDTAGNGFNVLLGSLFTLTRTRYIEFEYEWKGAWAKQKLSHAIDLLDGLKFTCYFAGDDKLWRITGCFQDYYDNRSWAYVACANRILAPKLSQEMEDLFKATVPIQ